jgi:hypothetical protein
MDKVIKSISKIFTTKTCTFYESARSLDELDEKPNYTKNPKS